MKPMNPLHPSGLDESLVIKYRLLLLEDTSACGSNRIANELRVSLIGKNYKHAVRVHFTGRTAASTCS